VLLLLLLLFSTAVWHRIVCCLLSVAFWTPDHVGEPQWAQLEGWWPEEIAKTETGRGQSSSKTERHTSGM